MARIVPNEPKLGKHYCQKYGVQHLHPELVKQNDNRDATGQRGQRSGNFYRVVEVLPVQQPLIGNEAPQVQVFPAIRVSVGFLYRRLNELPVIRDGGNSVGQSLSSYASVSHEM